MFLEQQLFRLYGLPETSSILGHPRTPSALLQNFTFGRQQLYAMILATSVGGFSRRRMHLPIELINVMDNMSRLKLCIYAIDESLQNICRHQQMPVFAIL
ncbi:hypothetical protein [Microcoleus sp. herbarium2]|uniref:hypothetical protein n=1 Tax=Microcoleus sp. herbarium2 TaxID=3055433 RepID=UPI002FD1B4F3